MPKPFANSAQITYSLVNGDWLLGIQTGNSTGDAGLPQMKHIKLSQLSDWVRGTYGQVWRYRGPFSASLPSDAQANDYFLATATFTVDSVTYTKDHLYAYNASGTWDDISDVLSQYASQAQVTDIDDRLTAAEQKIDAMGDGIVYKGEVATYADLAGIVDPQAGWEYFVTANASFYIYNGSSWDQLDNGIVQTITDGDTAHAPSGDAVYDALAAEAAARESEDSNLKSALQATNKRVTNLEQKAGDELTVNYPDSVYGMDEVPANVAEYGKVTKLRGVTRGVNQQVKNPFFTNDSYSYWSPPISSTGVASGGVITLTKTADTSLQFYQMIPTVATHYYLVVGELQASVNCEGYLRFGATASLQKVECTANVWTKKMYIQQAVTTSQEFNVYNFGLSVGDTIKFRNPILRDLTQYFSSDPSVDVSTITISDIQSKYPELLIPSAYDAGSLVSTEYSAVKSVGVNIWDEEWENGSYDLSTGSKSASVDNIRSKNYISCLSNTNYYIRITEDKSLFALFYDANKNFISAALANQANGFVKNTPSNCCYITFYCGSSYGATYNHDIQICLNSYADKTTYHPYKTDTLTLPSPVTLRSAGKVADTDELNVEVDGVEKRRQTKMVGQYTFTSAETWSYRGTNQAGIAVYSINIETFIPYKLSASTGLLFNLGLCLGSVASASSVLGNSDSKGIYYYYNELVQNERLFYAVGFTTAELATLKVNYELADPVVTLSDPIIDPFLKVEGGGTIRPIQTQTTEIDSAMTAEYLSLGA